MLGEPSESLGTCVFLSCDVCSRRSIFQHRNVGVVGLCETWVGAETFDFEVGDIYQAVDGEENYDMKVVEIIDESDFSRTVVFEPVDVTTDLSSAAYMEIKKGKLPGVVYLPTRAINVKVDSTFVYVVKENGFLEGRYVELGEEIGDLVVIKSGLDGTEEVAVKE